MLSKAIAAIAEVEFAKSMTALLLGPPHATGVSMHGRAPTSTAEPALPVLPGLPTLPLHCAKCKGSRNFHGSWAFTTEFLRHTDVVESRKKDRILSNPIAVFRCRNCNLTDIYMQFRVHRSSVPGLVSLAKVGQDPPYNIPPSEKLRKLLGKDDWQLYRQGCRAEVTGLGIGAVAYYRRVVDNQWKQLLNAIIDVAKLAHAPDVMEALQGARDNTQFATAIRDALPEVPPALRIGDHNPLVLLYDAFSAGVHEQSDPDALTSAQNGRVVLEGLVANIKRITDDQKALRAAADAVEKARATRKSAKKAPD